MEHKSVAGAKAVKDTEGRALREKVKESHESEKMSGDTKPNNGGNGGSGFRARLDHYLYSGDKKHVMAGIALISVVFAVPWYYMTRGNKQMSHQDYLEKADKARSERLSSGSAK